MIKCKILSIIALFIVIFMTSQAIQTTNAKQNMNQAEFMASQNMKELGQFNDFNSKHSYNDIPISLSNSIEVNTKSIQTNNINTDMLNSIKVSSNINSIQSLSSTGFISTWNTSLISTGSSSNNQVKFPLISYGSYNFTVNWGDGSNNTITHYNQAETTHNYSTSGVYTIIITGKIIGWKFDNSGDKLKIIEISNWGPFNFGYGGNYFDGCSNLVLTATDAPDLTGTDTLNDAFRNCVNLGSNGSMNTWNTSAIFSMYQTFYGDTSFNQSIGNWNVGKVGSMYQAFSGAESFNQPIGSWDVSHVANAYQMFGGASSFNQSIGSWNVANIYDMTDMFAGATSFNQDLSSWNVSTVVSMVGMFSISAFNHPINSWNVSSVTNMRYMFSGDLFFNQPLNYWKVSKVTNMGWMFSGTPFNQSIDSWDVSHVTTMDGMFSSANNFQQSLSSWVTSSVTDMSHMFSYNVFNQPINSWDVSNVQNFAYMFEGNTVFNQPLGSWYTISATDMSYMFDQASSFNQSLPWLVNNVVDMSYMFYQAVSFNQPLNWFVTSVTKMDNMFHGITLSITNYDTLLLTWSFQNLKNGVNFDAGNSKYSILAASARSLIISNHGWNITDGGEITPPGIPQNVQATNGNNQVVLSWNAPTTNGGSPILGYAIFRSISGTSYSFLVNVSASSYTYTDNSVTNGNPYYYYIVAYNVWGVSSPSLEVLAHPSASQTSNVSYTTSTNSITNTNTNSISNTNSNTNTNTNTSNSTKSAPGFDIIFLFIGISVMISRRMRENSNK